MEEQSEERILSIFHSMLVFDSIIQQANATGVSIDQVETELGYSLGDFLKISSGELTIAERDYSLILQYIFYKQTDGKYTGTTTLSGERILNPPNPEENHAKQKEIAELSLARVPTRLKQRTHE